MEDKEIKKAAVSKTEKKAEPAAKAKKELAAKAEPKKAEPKKAEAKKTEIKKVEPVKAETKKSEPKKIATVVEKPAAELVPDRTKEAVKAGEPKKKRISKGLATHNRRVKQEKRHPGMPKKKIK